MPRRKITFAIAICLAGAGFACADSISDTWLGGTGTWSDPTGWSAGSPNNAGAATYAPIVASGGTDQVTLDTPFTIDSLAIGGGTGSSVVQSGPGSLNLQVLGALAVGQTGSLSLSNGDTLTVGGNATNAGSIGVSSGASLGITGDLTTTPASRFSALVVGGSGILNVGGTLNNQSTLEVGGMANLNSLNNTGVVTIDGGGTLNLTGGGAGITDIASGSSYSVAGAFNVINGGTPQYALANLASVEGGLFLQNGRTTTLSSLSNSGGISLGGPGTALTVTGDLTNISVGRFSAIVVFGGSTLNVGGTLDNQSTLDVDGGTANINGLNNTGVVTIEAGGEACIGSLNNDGILNVDGSLNGSECGAQADFTLTEIITSANNFGVFNYSGPVTLEGTLDVELQDGFIPTVGESFDFINFPAGDLAGAFGKITNDFFDNNTEQWVIAYDNADGDVTLTAEAAQSAPEPSTLVLLAGSLATLGICGRRRRKSDKSKD